MTSTDPARIAASLTPEMRARFLSWQDGWNRFASEDEMRSFPPGTLMVRRSEDGRKNRSFKLSDLGLAVRDLLKAEVLTQPRAIVEREARDE